MSDYLNLYNDLAVVVGEDKLNKLILLERAANQRHWAKNVNEAVRASMGDKDTTKIMNAIHAVTQTMVKQADEYETAPKRKIG